MDIRKNTAVNGTAYGLALLGTIIGEVMDLHVLVYVCKPALMIILSSWFYFNSRRVGDRFTLLIQAGLFFSLLGDVAMMFVHIDQFNFLMGLGAFLVAQLCYTFAFGQNVADADSGQGYIISLLLTAVLIGYGFFFALALLPKVEDLIEVPVLIYIIAITLMGIGASFRFGRTFPTSFYLVFAGALLFITSDSILAYNRFINPVGHASWSVMLTYGMAQFFIVSGCLAHVLDPEEIRRKAALNT